MADIQLIRGSNGSGPAVRPVVTAARSSGSLTIKVNSTTNLPPRFIGTWGKLNQDTGKLISSSIRDFYGEVNGADIDLVQMADGFTDDGNAVGDVIVIKPNTDWANNLADVLLVSHNPDGTLKLQSGNGALNFAGGSPTGTVRYVVVGGICTVTVAIKINSAITGNYNAITGLPPQHSSIGTLNDNTGWVVSYKDASGQNIGTVTVGTVRTTVVPGVFRFSAVGGTEVAATVPFTWAAGDTITGSFSYPVA